MEWRWHLQEFVCSITNLIEETVTGYGEIHARLFLDCVGSLPLHFLDNTSIIKETPALIREFFGGKLYG